MSPSDCPRCGQGVGSKLPVHQAACLCCGAPRGDVIGVQMSLECLSIWPQLGKPDETSIEGILGDVISDASI